jgi:hypothetical protein
VLKRSVIFIMSLLILEGCSVLKRGTKEPYDTLRRANTIDLDEAVTRNITNSNFFISRAEIDINGEGINERAIGSIKYTVSDGFLISLRHRTGIEGARILISRDTVLINDRINRKFYFGSGNQMIKKYGFDYTLIPLMLGDFLVNDQLAGKIERCDGGEFLSSQRIGGYLIEYILNCRNLKAVYARTGINGTTRLKFSRYIEMNGLMMPGMIEIEDETRKLGVRIKIDKIEYPWDGEIDFIPGAKYEKIPLV